MRSACSRPAVIGFASALPIIWPGRTWSDFRYCTVGRSSAFGAADLVAETRKQCTGGATGWISSIARREAG